MAKVHKNYFSFSNSFFEIPFPKKFMSFRDLNTLKSKDIEDWKYLIIWEMSWKNKSDKYYNPKPKKGKVYTSPGWFIPTFQFLNLIKIYKYENKKILIGNITKCLIMLIENYRKKNVWYTFEKLNFFLTEIIKIKCVFLFTNTKSKISVDFFKKTSKSKIFTLMKITQKKNYVVVSNENVDWFYKKYPKFESKNFKKGNIDITDFEIPGILIKIPNDSLKETINNFFEKNNFFVN